MLDLSLPCYQEFFSFCEAMELVPKEELESFVEATGKTFADKRAQKVGFRYLSKNPFTQYLNLEDFSDILLILVLTKCDDVLLY